MGDRVIRCLRFASLSMVMLAGGVGAVLAQSRSYSSSNRRVRAQVVSVGRNSVESRVEIRGSNGKLIRRISLTSVDGSHGSRVERAAWTFDGQFFVFNASSSGGHQPWHLATYFYSRRMNRFYSLDDFVGPITSDFSLTAPNGIKTTRFNFSRNEQMDPVMVRLGRLSL
jgi:hypothetical protein